MFKSIFLLSLLAFVSAAEAEVFKSHPLSARTFSLAMEPEITLGGDEDFTFFVHGGYGIADGYALQVKLGFGESALNDDDVQISGMVDIPLFGRPRSDFGLFTAFGVSNWGDVSIENQLILFGRIGPVHLYGGLDDALRFNEGPGDDDVDFPIELVFGMEAPIRSTISILFEGGIELNDSSSYISGGVRFYF